MKKTGLKLKFSRRILNFLFIFLVCGGGLFVWQTVANLQTKKNVQTEDSKNRTASIQSARRGNPYINFKDGTDLTAPDNARNDNSQPKVLTSADFDSDGIADLLTADVSGNLRFYRGTFLRKGDEEQSFELTGKNFALNISPDFLFAGDFNADGKQDVLAAAKDSNFLVLLVGDGRGNFSVPNAVKMDGQISAIAAGETGRKDGQTDVVVAFSNSKGAFLAVFEHPESAFKHKPEIFKLPAPANDLAIGNLDEDFYADIAVASGNNLTIIHGRGQAYPWDLIPQSGIMRPAAFVAVRQIPFAISAMTVGRFGTKRGETLAILGQDGNIYRLEPNRKERPSNNKLKNAQLTNLTKNLFIPSDTEARNLAILGEPQITREEAERQGQAMFDKSEISGGKLGEFLHKKQAEATEKFKKMSKEEREKIIADALPKKAEFKERAKQGFLRSISGKPSTLANWTIETLTQNAQLASAAASNSPNKMQTVNVSSSNLDDILLVDSITNQIHLVSQPKTEDQRPKTEITNLEAENGLRAVLPLRLNTDALSDLVVLRENSSVPSVVMTAPMNVFVVTSDNEDGDCQGANLCSLRNAITLANQTPGVDSIFFSIGSATIAPTSPLPVITEGLTISGPITENFQPLVEISGTNLSGQGVDGLKIRTSNAAILGLAVNQFPSVVDENGSQIGGNGITIESTVGSPNNGNNFIAVNYLGTDKTGSLDKGNGGAGLNIFDADDNQISDNLISGNGSPEVRGVGISVTAGNNNLFHGNIIGLNSLGTAKLGNSEGVFLTGANNQFGGDGIGQGNTVSGNHEIWDIPNNLCQGRGMIIVGIFSLETGEQLSLNNDLKGNRVGTNPAGTVGLGNCEGGISTSPYIQTNIGSITQSGRNLVSDNGRGGISCLVYSDLQQIPGEGGFCQIAGNNIGTDITGNIGISNDGRNHPSGFFTQQGVVNIGNTITYSNVGAPGGTTPNGACTGFCNLISGSENVGFAYGTALKATGYGTVGIFNNYIGTNQSGNAAIPNDVGGIFSTSWFGTTLIGGDVPNLPLGNVVSGNKYVNISVGANHISQGFAGSSSIMGNRIGTDVSGNFSLQPSPGPNDGNEGVIAYARFAEEVYIGSAAFEGRNIISGNKSDGGEYGGGNGIVANVYVANSYGGFIKIANNLVGLNSSLQPLGNQAHGILAGNGVQIGGTDQEANQIAYNGTNGRNFAGVAVEPDSFGVTIRNNSIHDNLGLGIDLNVSGVFGGADGVTANDCQDADIGANGLQNYPTLYAPTQNGDGTLTVTGFLRSRRNQTFMLDFYRSQTADDSTYGEGSALIGSANVTTDGNGFGEFSFTSALPVSTSLAITATATDVMGNTSEFSCAAGVCASNLTEEARRLLGIQCSEPIVVNVATDEPDVNTSDGVCDVDTSDQILQCTLRAAIQEANARPGYNQIRFEIPGAGVHTIFIGDNLPEINGLADLNATTQNGYAGTPLIKLDGGNKGGAGLKGTGNSVTISGFSIVGFDEGINLRNAVGAYINKCHIGVNSDGETYPSERMDAGIVVRDGGGGNVIGGYQEADRNVISNNQTGIRLFGTNGNFIVNNTIGLNAFWTAPIPNEVGISVEFSDGNRIGGTDTVEANIIGGNTNSGIVLANSSRDNRIAGNYLGFNPDNPEISTLGNRTYGVLIASGATNNSIGSTIAGERNHIGFSQEFSDSAGIFIAPDSGIDNYILGNSLGVYYANSDASYHDISNRVGVLVRRGRQYIGHEYHPNSRNRIGRNIRSGIVVQATEENAITGVKIYNNDIGIEQSEALGNGGSGIYLDGDVSESLISRNLISGNIENGITINGGYENRIVGNFIGTDSNGDLAVPNQLDGIALNGSDNQIGDAGQNNSNLISGNSGTGVAVFSGSIGNTLRKNLIGTNSNGNNFIRNQGGGVILKGSENTLKENIISGNASFGVALAAGEEDPPDQNNRLITNNIGTTSDGQNELGNGFGVFVGETARTNFIEKSNLISGNHSDGIRVSQGASATFIRGNLIGTTTDGNSALGNTGNGVYIFGRTTIVGGETNEDENVISGNFNGIVIEKSEGSGAEDGRFNVVTNNIIGLNQSGTQSIGNQNDGVLIFNGANNNIIGFAFDEDGNPISGTGNLISGNNGGGIRIFTDENSPEASDFNIISGNQVGVSIDESIALANMGSGITITDSPQNFIGNSDISPANIVSGNTQNGILIEGAGAFENFVISNHVGITTEGNALGNGLDGLLVSGAPGTVLTNNNVGGNLADGIVAENLALSRPTNRKSRELRFDDDKFMKYFRRVFNNRNLGSSSYSIEISANSIGVFGQTSVPNGQNGIRLSNTQNALIGGTQPNSGNTIRNNGGAGVRLDETPGNNNLINHNSILGNTGLGIDLGTIGHTPNDPLDADTGANNLQNYPEITSQTINGSGDLIVSYNVDSAPTNSDYGTSGLRIEFFKSDLSGEGELFLNADYYTESDYNSLVSGVKTINLGNAAAIGFGTSDRVTATTTDASGNTSEFFPPFAPTAANVSVSGKVVSASGSGISKATVLLTDENGQIRTFITNSFGNFRFEDVEVGRIYIFSVRHKSYVFTPQIVSVDGEVMQLILAATP